MDIIKEKMIKYAPNMKIENIALIGLILLSFGTFLGLFIPKKFKNAFKFSSVCVIISCLIPLALSILRLEKETEQEM